MPTNPLIAPTQSSSAPAIGGAPAAGGAGGLLGKDDFLKLLIGQMQHQDPLNPTDGTEYMGQLTQFSILERLTNLTDTSSAAASNEYDAQAIALIGKTVTYKGANDTELTGVVERVTFSTQGPSLTIGGIDGISPVAVTKVA